MTDLKGVVVLDLTRLLPGAVATQHLADWGAEIIKIEQPGAGDYARTMSPSIFKRTNAGKKSIVLDLKNPRGREILTSMACTADVLIEGNRPGVMERLGLCYSELSAVNKRLIYVSLTGYGQRGPYTDLAGHDINYMALGGVLSLNLPVIPGVQIADLVGGSMQTVMGILLALVARHRTGEGRHVDVSMYDGVTSLLTVPLAGYRETGCEPRPGSEMLSGRYACYNIYEAADGRWLAVGALEPKFWAELCRHLGCEDLIPRQFEEPQDPVKARIAAIFRTKGAHDWFDQLRGSDSCVTPVRTVGEVAAELPDREGPRPPAMGEHTFEVLSRSGLAPTEIEELKRQGVIA
ncbi:MAG TPA: CaiB/BaiF CoA-transferase family protein [Bryobacteraceae bacterium]|jgi:crotonobetainyl-CoA:carnitine CoA-transferase CaiB-like acyl-CoA transferase|nr:CaiB/BaiF CoA-transferase family protein [Bryobacteraceae bacterium]